jgi:hypothetical protein
MVLGVQLPAYFLLININLPWRSRTHDSQSIPVGERLLDSKNELQTIIDAFSLRFFGCLVHAQSFAHQLERILEPSRRAEAHAGL